MLVDWSVRESHHALDYLADQNVARDRYEIIWVEYYDAEPAGLRDRMARATELGTPPPIDQWIVLGMPPASYYHKHLLYNVGLVASRGRIVTFCDSDAIFGRGFVGAHLDAFAGDPRLVLHLDEVRSRSRTFYPFSHPSIADVLASDCINLVDGRPAGIPGPDGEGVRDALHTANYGACMSARRADLIAIGGADEHLDFLGHVCGPYDMTFRLVNADCYERWHESEWIFHTWHPGASGEKNFVGPHDGRHVSSTALRARETGRVLPLVENPAVRALREAVLRPSLPAGDDLLECATAPGMAESWSSERLSLYSREDRSPGALLRAHPVIAARAAVRVVRATSAYAALIARTSGLMRTPALGEDRGSALVARTRSISGKARKLVTRSRLPFELTRDVAAAVREQLSRARQRLEGLASEGVRELQLYETAELASAVRAFAPAYGIRIVRSADARDGDAALDALDRDGPPLLLARRFSLSQTISALVERGFDPRCVLPLDPEWLVEARLPKAVEETIATSPGDVALSVVMPTRGRPDLARATLEGLAKMATQPAAIEVVLYVDDDDSASHEIGCDALRIVRLKGERAPMGAITSRCVAAASGRIVLLLNDDVRVATAGWDARIAAAFARFDDGIALVWGDDLHQRGANPTFPAISRAAIDALGWVTAPQFIHFHIESHLFDVFARLARAGHERRVFLPDVVFEHHFEIGGAGAAGTGRKRHAQRDRVTYGLLGEERALAAERLRAVVEHRGVGARDATVARTRREAAVEAVPVSGVHRPSPAFEIETIGTTPDSPTLTLVFVADERERTPYGGSQVYTAPGNLEETGLAPGAPTETRLVRWRSGSLGAALAAAMQQAQGDAIVCLPLGTEVPADFATRLAADFAAHPRCAAWRCVIAEQRCDRVRRTSARLVRERDCDVVREDHRGVSLSDVMNAADERPVPEGAGLFALALRRSAFEAAGGLARDLSSDLLLGLDVCRRLATAGYELRALPDLVWRLPPDGTPLMPDEIARVASRLAATS